MHEVDDRPMSLWARIHVAAMRAARDKRAFEGAANTRRRALSRQRRGDRPPTLLTRMVRDVTRAQVAGMTVWTVRPRRQPARVRVLYLHGGGYVHPLTPDYWRLVRALSGAPAEVVVPAYPLAPGATADEVVPRLLEVVRDPGGLPTVVMGDSAGGALTLVLAQQVRDTGGVQPARLVALCPWLDATLDEATVRDLESSDPMLAESGLRAAGRWWAGGRDPADPLVSPLFGGLGDLAPLDVWIGDRDILRPAVDELERRAPGSALRLTVHEVPSMFHVWMTHEIPEARRTRRDLVRLVAAQAED
jgi:acetyl esterase/lipase